MADDETRKYKVDIGLKNGNNLTTILCREGVDKLFADVAGEKEFVIFYCCEGDKTLLRTSEISFLISYNLGEK